MGEPGPGGLLERQREIATLEHALTQAVAGHGQLVVVEGPLGIGKTTLIGVAHTLARERGLRVLAARGSPLEHDFSFGIVRGLFERLAPWEDERSSALFAGAAGLARRVLAESDGGGGPAREVVSHAILHGLYWFTANVASGGPLLLTIDDCQWADDPSLRYLAHLAARLEGLPILVLLALRSGDPPSESVLIRHLCALATREPIRLTTLGPAASAELVRAELGQTASERFCLACHTATGGNPLLLRALVASLAAEGQAPTDEAAANVTTFGAEGVARVLWRRLATLPAGAEPLLRALCILGVDPPLRHLAALAGLELEQAMLLVDALRGASILAASDELDFAHPILRAAVSERISREERARAHGRAAGLLAAEGAPADRLAVHLLQTRPRADQTVVRTLRAAAALAAERGAPETAAVYLRRALAEPPEAPLRGTLCLELGLAELAARRDVDAVPHLVEGVAAIGPPERCRAALLAGRALGLVGRFEEAAGILESALTDRPPRGETELLVAAELLANSWLLASRVPAAQELVARFREGDCPPGVARDLMLVHLAVRELREACPPATGWQLLDRALASGEVLRQESVVIAWVMMALVWTDRLTEAEQISSALIREGERRGSAYLVAHLSFPRAFVAHVRGRLREAEADARWGLEQKLARGVTEGRTWHLIPLVNALVDQGELEGAERVLAIAHVPVAPSEQMGWARGARGVWPLAARSRASRGGVR